MPASGQEGWYGADEEWPRHPKPWFRNALEKARRAGWLYRKNSSHSHGTLYCRDPAIGPCCKYPVFSTGRAGENAAREVERLISRCQHDLEKRRSALVNAEGQMVKAEKLIRAAEALVDRAHHEQASAAAWARAVELVDLAGTSVHEVDAMLAHAVQEEAEARAADQDAAETLAPFPDHPPHPPDLVDAAEKITDDVKTSLGAIPANDQVASLRLRVSDARRRLRLLRARLSPT
jgi:hypothetical protein